MPPRKASSGSRTRTAAATKRAAALAKPEKGTVAAEDVRLQAKADRTRGYMAAARLRQEELERGGFFF